MLRGFRFIFRNLNEECRILSNGISTGRLESDKRKKIQIRQDVLKRNKLKYEDTFGDVEKFERIFQNTKEDPEDVLQYERERAAKGKTIIEYLREIKSHLSIHDYKSAINVLEVDMVNDKKPANPFVYRVLISYNAAAGNLEEAYRLYLRFKERQGVVDGGMYTSMFNACANCQNSMLALDKAKAIRESMYRNEHHSPNISNYNVMLKAFGRHGDIKTCFQIMDEVLEKKDKVRDETYVFLLQACASDSNSGLRFALLTWRKMLQNRVKPNTYAFNTMLRVIRDCGLGDALLIPDLMKEVMEESKVFYRRKVNTQTIGTETKRTVTKILTDGSDMTTSETSNVPMEELEKLENHDLPSEIKNQSGDMELPNFLSLNPSFGSVIEFGVMTEPHHRFMLAGGVKGFLKSMAEFGIQPDIKTFTLMLQIIPSTLEAEEELIAVVSAYKVPFDVNFFNVLIKKRIFRGTYDSVKSSLEQMYAFNIQPDVYTFGTLALTCDTHKSAKELLDVIRTHGFSLNPPILHSLLKKAIRSKDLNYVLDVIHIAKEDGVKLGAKFLSSLSDFVEKEKKLRKERKEAPLEDVSPVLEKFDSR